MLTLSRRAAALAAALLATAGPAALAAQAHAPDSAAHPVKAKPAEAKPAEAHSTAAHPTPAHAAPAHAAAEAHAQTGHAEVHADPIATSRPGLTEYTGVVPRGRLQFEGGYSVARTNGEHHHSIGEARFRFGIGGNAELRLDLNSFAVATHDGHALRGYEDAEVGVKTALGGGHSPWLPSAAVVLSTTVPSGSGDFAAGVLQPTGALSLGWKLPEHVGLLGTVRYAHLSDHGQRSGLLTGATTLSLPAWGPLHSHLEYAMIVPVEHSTERIHHVSGGYGYHVGHDAQLDMWGGIAARHEKTEWLFGVGLSRRW